MLRADSTRIYPQMHPLHQRLRELDCDTFQRFAFQLISAKYPDTEIRHVEGAGGDQGLDLFSGELDGRPVIWQCKHFPNGLGVRQRPQVTDSLRTAMKHFTPSNWILVVSVDLDTKTHVWFQKLQRAYAQSTGVGLFEGSDIVRELIHRRSIRDAFFPGAVLDSIAVARAIKGLDDLPQDHLERITQESVEEQIARLEEADARFNYRIVYGPNLGAAINEVVPLQPLLLASVFDENKRVDVFARDLEALRLAPPTITLVFNEPGLGRVNTI